MLALYFVLMMTAASATDASAPLPARLTLAQALTLFHERGFDLLVAEAAIENAQGDVKVANSVSNPVLSVGYGKSFDYPSNGPSDVDFYTAGFTDSGALLDILSGKRGLRVGVARAALTSAEESRDDAQRTLDYLVKSQYLAVAVDKANLVFSLKVQETLNKTQALFALRYQQGDVSEADLARIEVATLEGEQTCDTARQQLQIDKVGLAFLLGVRGLAPVFEVEEAWLEGVAPTHEEALSLADLIDMACSLRPDLRAQAAEKDRALQSISLQRRQLFPEVDWSLNYQGEGTGAAAIQPPTLNLGVSITLPLFYQYQGEILKAQVDYRSQDILYDKALAQVASDIGTAHINLTASRSRLTRMQQRLRSRAARALELVRLQYDKGAASLLDLLDAQRTFIATNQEYFGNLSDYWTARFFLEQAVGTQGKP